jgi:hypothetical protein
MKAYGGSGCIDPHFLDLGTSWRWVVSFTPRPLYPRGKSHSTHWIGGWVGPRAGLDDVEKRKFLTLSGRQLRSVGGSACSQSLSRLLGPCLKTIKRQYIYSSIDESEVVLVFERNDAGLKKLSQVLSEQTSDSSAVLNATWVRNCRQHFSYFDPD